MTAKPSERQPLRFVMLGHRTEGQCPDGVACAAASVGGMRAPELAHHFCPACMALRYGSGRSSLEKPNRWLFVRFANRSSRMFTRPLGMPFVNVRPTMFDDTS